MHLKNIFTLSLCIKCLPILVGQEPCIILPWRIVPIEYTKHIYIQGTIEGVEGDFLLDTGADNLYFDSLFYERSNFGFDSLETGWIPGVGKELQKVRIIKNAIGFDFGGCTYLTRDVPIIRLKAILGDFADGIIGLDYFSNQILEVNYRQKYLRTYEIIDSEVLNPYTKIQCEKIHNRLYVPVKLTINDSVSIKDKFLLDLGCGSTIVITHPVAQKYHLDKVITQKAKHYSQYRGVGGDSEGYRFLAGSVNLGGYTLHSFEADYSSDERGSLASDLHAGLLGNKILDRFDLIIDFSANCLYIKPNSAFSDPFPVSKSGFFCVDRSESFGGFIVTGFFEGSQAEASGLKIGDQIIEMNHIPVKEFDDKKREEYLQKKGIIQLKIRRGAELLNIEFMQNRDHWNEWE